MQAKSLVKLSNIVGSISIVFLIYWVFIFTSMQIFGLRIFRKQLTDTFYMSILGILALMVGALIINVMFNLTRIAEKHNQDESAGQNRNYKKKGLLFLLSFPIIFIMLLGGDYISASKKKNLLIQSAHSMIQSNPQKMNTLVDYKFEEKWLIFMNDFVEVLEKTDKYFPHITVIVRDTFDNSPIFLGFRNYYRGQNDKIILDKKRFIIRTTKVEREYLNKIFDQKENQPRFVSEDGKYELYYPYQKENKIIVLLFSDYQRYGKMGR